MDVPPTSSSAPKPGHVSVLFRRRRADEEASGCELSWVSWRPQTPAWVWAPNGVQPYQEANHFSQLRGKVTVSRPVGGILSSSRRSLGGHPSERPTWGSLPLGRRASNPFPTLGLAPGGVYRAERGHPDAGALLPHRFTLTCVGPEARHCRFPFCGTVLRVAPLAVSQTLLCGVPTFLDRSRLPPAPRPPGRPTVTLF